MKLTTLLIALSLAANAIFGVRLFRTAPAPASLSPAQRATSATASAATAKSAALRAALESGDFAALCAAGVPVDVARNFAAGSAYARYRAKLRAIQPTPDLNPRYWRASELRNPRLTPEQRTALTQAEREFSDTLVSLFGEGASLAPTPDWRLTFLPTWKQEQVRRIEQDFDDQMASLRGETIGLPLPADREKQSQLLSQRERDLAALLTPAEHEMFELRGSREAFMRMESFGDGLETEADFRALVAALQAHATKFESDPLTGGLGDIDRVRASNEDMRRTYEQIHQTLGDERFAALQRAKDSDRQQITALSRRLNLPPETTDRVLALREVYAGESQRLAVSLSDEASYTQRRAQFQALATRAREELTTLLGAEAAQAYSLRQQNWPELLSRGVAFTTNRNEMPMGPSSVSATYPWSPPPPSPTAPAKP